MKRLPKVCVIGAGSSGIAAAKALQDCAIPFDCFDKSDRVGGNWVFKNANGMSSAYRSLHINTSRNRMQYADFPMPRDYPDFPDHARIARYFDAYVDRFGLRERITFNTGVVRCERLGFGRWRVDLDTEESRLYDALVVANGHHWDPQWPEPPFPGEFDGIEMHSHAYIDPTEPHDLVGKRVVVLGMGNSAMDIASELGRAGVAARVWLAARRGAHVIPKYLFGKPLDALGVWRPWMPDAVGAAIGKAIFRVAVGRMSDYGLPEPEHELWEAHPTISSEILVRVGSGDVVPKPNIAEKMGKRVRFADGSVEDVDAIVYCTGYRVSFPFFDPAFLAAPSNDLPLWRRLCKPEMRDLFFIGLCQPLGAVMPIAERQGKLVAAYLSGAYALPPEDAMRAEMEADRVQMFDRYVASRRHTMQVDFDRYMYELAGEIERGAKRAAKAGNPLPIAPRAGEATAPTGG